METIKEKTFSKLFVRCAKDNGKYMQLLKYASSMRRLTVPKETFDAITEINRNIRKLKFEVMTHYPHFVNQGEYINEFAFYIANNVIGLDNCYKLFKNFVIEHYGKKCFKDYENYVIKDSYSKEQLKRFKEIFKINSNDIKKIIEKKQIQLYLAPIGYIFYGFSWRKTKEGFVFWSQINQEWISYIFSYIVNNKLIYNP